MAGRKTPFARFNARHDAARAYGWLPVDLGGHEVISRLHMQLKPGPEAAGEGRHALDRLQGSLEEEQLDELRLLVTELLTNSVRHSGNDEDWINFDLEIYANSVRGVVTDRGPGFEPVPKPRPDAERPGGWGLCLVDSLADRWGVEVDDVTAVWFEVDRSGRFARAG